MNLDVLQDYLKHLKEKYKTGGIWIAKRMGRRISFYVGFEPEFLKPPEKFFINKEFLLFCENPIKMKKDIEKVISELKIIIEKGGYR